MGKLLRLHGVSLTDAMAPKIITRDKIESIGSLMLFDGNHQFGQFNGLPAAGADIPNALSNIAAGVLGVNEAQTALKVLAVSADAPTVFKKERTLKGGIHGIVTQSGAQVSAQMYFMCAADAVRNYVRDNPGHNFYFSLWQRITRKALASAASQAPFYFTNGVSATSNYRFHMQGGQPFPSSTSPTVWKGSKTVPAASDKDVANDTNRFTSLAVQGDSGNGPIGTDPIALGVGTYSAWNALNYNAGASRIIYRAYIEDLTVSGRTYAEVEAIDYALYKEAFAPGGKFHGDTYTAPSTLP